MCKCVSAQMSAKSYSFFKYKQFFFHFNLFLYNIALLVKINVFTFEKNNQFQRQLAVPIHADLITQ